MSAKAIAFVLVLTAMATSLAWAAASDSFLVVEGRVVRSDIKYTPMGKVTGAGYAGLATVQVIETLRAVALASPNRGQQISIAVEERSKKPTWEKPSSRNFIFLLAPIGDRPGFRAVHVIAASPELVRIARERKYDNLQTLQALLADHEK